MFRVLGARCRGARCRRARRRAIQIVAQPAPTTSAAQSVDIDDAVAGCARAITTSMSRLGPAPELVLRAAAGRYSRAPRET